MINHETHKKRFANISALAVLKPEVKKGSKDNAPTSHKFVFHDNDEMCTYVVNESDGLIVAQTDKKLAFHSYGICCSHSPNFIYVADYTNNKIRKFSEDLNQVGELKIDTKVTAKFSGPCQMNLNSYLEQIAIVDQNNCRVVIFDMKTNEYLSEFKLFEEDLAQVTRPSLNSFRMDLTNKLKGDDHIEDPVGRAMLDFKPFGIYTKLERIYVTDWNRGSLYMYKNSRDNVYKLERKIKGDFTRPRDVLLDTLDSMLIVDMDEDIFYFHDNKGTYLFETPVPKHTSNDSHFKEKGVFGLAKLADRFIFASNSTIYICKLSALIED